MAMMHGPIAGVANGRSWFAIDQLHLYLWPPRLVYAWRSLRSERGPGLPRRRILFHQLPEMRRIRTVV
jgi:hypothetical protein